VEQAPVVEPIDPITKSWNLTLIGAVFLEDEAKIISTIPLSPLQPKNQLIWRGTKNGKFTVRSAYYLAVEKQGQSRGESSGTSSMEKFWKTIWSLAVQNSVKMLIWKACNNILPTKDNLFKRRVVDHTTCLICERDEETVLHALWACPGAQDAWGCGSAKLQKLSTNQLSFLNLIEELMDRCDSEEIELGVVLTRKIWLRRNSVVYGGFFTHLVQLFKEAKVSVEEFHRFNDKENRGIVLQENLSLPIWKPPPSGFLKANWDAAVKAQEGQVGVGIIVRDCEGCVLAARSTTFFLTIDPTIAEAWAALQAILFCKELGFFDICFEGDSLQVVKECSTDLANMSRYGHILDGIKSGLQSFRSANIVHVKREANSAAHRLARATITHVVDSIWMEEIPPQIYDIVIKELVVPMF
jgi:ribonuclease HI